MSAIYELFIAGDRAEIETATNETLDLGPIDEGNVATLIGLVLDPGAAEAFLEDEQDPSRRSDAVLLRCPDGFTARLGALESEQAVALASEWVRKVHAELAQIRGRSTRESRIAIADPQLFRDVMLELIAFAAKAVHRDASIYLRVIA